MRAGGAARRPCCCGLGLGVKGGSVGVTGAAPVAPRRPSRVLVAAVSDWAGCRSAGSSP